jgi:hypothetical protein
MTRCSRLSRTQTEGRLRGGPDGVQIVQISQWVRNDLIRQIEEPTTAMRSSTGPQDTRVKASDAYKYLSVRQDLMR